MIKILKFDGSWILSEVEEIGGVEFGDPDCVLKYPYEIVNGELLRYPFHSNDNEIAVRSSDITVIAEPTENMLGKYLTEKTKSTES